MMKIHKYTLLLLVVSFLAGCRSTPKPSSDYLVLDEIVFVHDFPSHFTLGKGKPFDLGIMGMKSMTVRDSILIVSTSDATGIWSFFSLPDYQFKGKYLLEGRGPNEFLSRPWVGQQFFFEKESQLFATIYDYSSLNLYEMNITKTLQEGRLSMRKMNFSLPDDRFACVFIDTTRLLCSAINAEQTQLTRYIFDNSKKERSANLEKLSLAHISPGEDINILSVHTKSLPAKNRIVEAALGLNQINLYSLDDSFGKTICVGEKIDNIRDIEAITPKYERISCYTNLSAYPEFFAALYLGDTEKNYQTGESVNPVIQLFDWDGNPLAEVAMDRMITSFTIDFASKKLLTLNLQEDEMYVYDIREILSKIKFD
jgi:hypothetical protein